MSERDDIADVNERHWERMVAEGCGFTRPWLGLDRALVRRCASGELDPVPEPLAEMYPADVLAGVEGKDVLCLASGGGQQSAAFGLLGARVTVADLSEGQLSADREAAAHHGYEVATVRADMRDLSCLGNGAFDLVYQAPSMSYVPDVREVYAGAARVLRPGGRYRTEFSNPATEFVDCEHWDGQGYRITMPYAQRTRRRGGDGEGVIEFRHTLADIFGGLLEAGFHLEQVREAPRYLRQDPDAPPGSWGHWLTYVTGFAVVARNGRDEPGVRDMPERS